MNLMENTIIATDSYKVSHWKQLPPKTQFLRSYLEPRGGPYKYVVTYGALQPILRELLGHPITHEMIAEADDFWGAHFGSKDVFNKAGWKHIMYKHDGWLPLRVRAVPEGMILPISNILLSIENTDPEVPWLTNYMETTLYPWYPYTIATLDHHCYQVILKYLKQNGTPAEIDFKLHDFAYRGTTDQFVGWQAAIGGSAHMLNFKGTDTSPALMLLRKFYNCPMAGFSIPASEHSTITSWMGLYEKRVIGEALAYKNMLIKFPSGLVACVSDSDDIYYACEKLWGEQLKDDVLARPGVLVIRPDSGDPCEVTLKCLEILWRKFGGTRNTKGYKVLDSHVRLIWGDGLNGPTDIDKILFVMDINGWSADNIAFGMGGGLLQRVNRDTMRFAMKCMSVVVDGKEYDVSKNPVTDPGKKSKAGNLTLYLDERKQPNEYVTMPRVGQADAPGTEIMRTVYENGRVFLNESFDTIRQRLRASERVLETAA